jgi:transmembrane protein
LFFAHKQLCRGAWSVHAGRARLDKASQMSSNVQTNSPGVATRLLFAGLCAPFWISGLDKLLDLDAAAREIASFGMRHSSIVAVLVILVQLGGSMLVAFGRGRAGAAGAFALAVFTAAATWLAHAFWSFPGPARSGEMNIFFEHVSILFGLVLAARVHLQAAVTPKVSPRSEGPALTRLRGARPAAGHEANH